MLHSQDRIHNGRRAPGASSALPNNSAWECHAPGSLNLYSQLILKILLADDGRLFRRPRLVGHAVKLNPLPGLGAGFADDLDELPRALGNQPVVAFAERPRVYQVRPYAERRRPRLDEIRRILIDNYFSPFRLHPF
jgi:hypothetical protein